ncbi:hypothetical protein BC567DRAFT_17393 [Phyllosticta citribraziliensis]
MVIPFEVNLIPCGQRHFIKLAACFPFNSDSISVNTTLSTVIFRIAPEKSDTPESGLPLQQHHTNDITPFNPGVSPGTAIP